MEEFSVEYKDSVYNLDHISFYREYVDTLENIFEYDRFSYSNISLGMVIPVGETVDILQTIRSDENIMDPFDSLFSSGADLVLRYSSVYEQMWEIQRFHSLPILLEEEPKVIQSMLD